MDIIIDWEVFQTTFKGEEITMELLPLETKTLLNLGAVASSSDPSKTMDLIGDIFPGHVRNVKGLTISGETPTPEQFATISKLYPLTTTILTQLGMISQLTEEDVKNSNGPSDSQTSDSNGTK